MEGTILLVALIYVAIMAFFASIMRNVVFEKGYDDSIHAWALCFWLGMLGWIFVLALPDLEVRKKQERIISLLENGSGRKENEPLVDELPDL